MGGATFPLLVSLAAQTNGLTRRGILSIPTRTHAASTASTLLGAGLVSSWASARALDLHDRVGGVLVTAIAVTPLMRGGTGLVEAVVRSLH